VSPPTSDEIKRSVLRAARISVGSGDIDTDAKEALKRWIQQPRRELGTLLGPIVSVLSKHNVLHSFSKKEQVSLQRAALASMQSDLVHQQLLQEVSRLLADRGIPIIALKNSAYGKFLYSSVYPRTSCDVDILVRPEDFSEAGRVLADYAEIVPDPLVPLENADLLFERSFRFRGNVSGMVELHWALTPHLLFDINPHDLWEGSVSHCDPKMTGIRCLCPEHTLIHLAVHGFRDLEILSHSLLDTYEMIEQCTINWDTLCESAKNWRTQAVTYYWLHQAWHILDAKVPLWVLEKLKPVDWRIFGLDWAFRKGRRRSVFLSSPITRIIQLLSLVCGIATPKRVLHYLAYRRRMLRS
jgi:hypothetical protein